MDYSYITEEAIWTRTAAYKTPEWESVLLCEATSLLAGKSQ